MATEVVLDSKLRADFGLSFKPGDKFIREVNEGTVLFRKIGQPAPRLLRARKIKGRWVGARDGPTPEEILNSVRRDRELR